MANMSPSASSAPTPALQPAPAEPGIQAAPKIPSVHQTQQHTAAQPSLSSWQQSGYTQPTTQALLHRLTQGLTADKTDPSTATVKVS